MEIKATEEKIKVQATLDDIDIILDKIEALMEPTGASPRTIKAVQLSIEEIFVNICSYAYTDEYTGERDCEINWRLEETDQTAKLSVCLKDHGVPFDPFAMEDPDISLKIADRGIGGMGVFMVKQCMDRYTYEYKDEQNIVLIEKEWQIDI